jgi:hypothetical protein
VVSVSKVIGDVLMGAMQLAAGVGSRDIRREESGSVESSRPLVVFGSRFYR